MDKTFLKGFIDFILKADHVNHLSSGSRHIRCTERWVQCPIIVTKVSFSQMWRNDVESVEEELIKAWGKDILDGKKKISLENEERNEDDISGQGNVY